MTHKMIKAAFTSDGPAKEYSLKRFEELFGVRYSPHLEFADWRTEEWIRKKCAKAYKRGAIGQLALWLGKLHGKQIEAGCYPDTTIRWINEDVGYGLFTNRALKKWEFIGEYTGILRRRNLFFSNINDYCFMYPREWLSFKAFTIDGDKQGSATRFINHSDYPNCESVAVFHDGIFHIIFRATENIAADSQLTYDYGDVYWRNRKKIKEEPIEELIDPLDFQMLQNDKI